MFSSIPVLSVRLGLAALLVFTANASEIPGAHRLVPGELLTSIKIEPGMLAQDTGSNFKFHIEVIQGEDAVNIVKRKTAVQPVVEVRDRNNLPVGGAAVTFLLPGHGPSGVFANGSRSITVTTNSAGRAAITGMKPVGTGAFKISVSASFQGQVATTTIVQTNVMTVAAAASAGAAGTVAAGGAGTGAGLSAGVIAAIVGGIAAAAAVGAVVATHGGGHSTSTPTVTIGVGAGTTTVGAPH